MTLFANDYQGGQVFEVFSPQGRDPMGLWKVSGSQGVKKTYDRSVKGYIFCSSRGPLCKMQLPKDELKTMHLIQPYLCLQVFLTECQPFSFELRVNCSDGARRRLLFSTCFFGVKATALHCQIPLSVVQCDRWTNLTVHVAGIVQAFFPGVLFKSVDMLVLGGTFKLRRLFTLRYPPMDTVGTSETFEGTATIPRGIDFPNGVAAETQVLEPGKLSLWVSSLKDNACERIEQENLAKCTVQCPGDTTLLTSTRSKYYGPMHVAFGSRFPILPAQQQTPCGAARSGKRYTGTQQASRSSHVPSEKPSISPSQCWDVENVVDHRENVSPNARFVHTNKQLGDDWKQTLALPEIPDPHKPYQGRVVACGWHGKDEVGTKAGKHHDLLGKPNQLDFEINDGEVLPPIDKVQHEPGSSASSCWSSDGNADQLPPINRIGDDTEDYKQHNGDLGTALNPLHLSNRCWSTDISSLNLCTKVQALTESIKKQSLAPEGP